jgi:hypothetical protein
VIRLNDRRGDNYPATLVRAASFGFGGGNGGGGGMGNHGHGHGHGHWGGGFSGGVVVVAPSLALGTGCRQGMGLQLNRIDCLGMQSPDETKFFDARNSAETEVPYSSKPSGTQPDINLIDLEPRLALAGAFLGRP